MRSNDGAAPRSAPPPWVALALLAVSVLAIGSLRWRVAERFHRLKARSDVYALPSADQLVVASLGYRAALADLLFVNTVISYSVHFQEKRRFEYVGHYLDAVTTLDPTFYTPYLFADTLIVMQAVPARLEDYVKARELIERGMKAFPYDAVLWVNAGQYMAYLAAPYIEDKKLKEQWKLDGARILARACEFVSTNENIPYHCITAATLYSKAGEREASISFLERVLAMTDDEEIRRIASGYLERMYGQARLEKAEFRQKHFRERWGADLRFVPRDLLLALGPRFDPALCAGLEASRRGECASTWRAWGERLREQESP